MLPYTQYAVDLAGNLTFAKNVALTGGVKYTQVNMNSTTYFIKDSAHHEGGAMQHIRSAKMNISSKSVLKHNSAAMRGRSVFETCTTINFTGIILVANTNAVPCTVSVHAPTVLPGYLLINSIFQVHFRASSLRLCWLTSCTKILLRPL